MTRQELVDYAAALRIHRNTLATLLANSGWTIQEQPRVNPTGRDPVVVAWRQAMENAGLSGNSETQGLTATIHDFLRKILAGELQPGQEVKGKIVKEVYDIRGIGFIKAYEWLSRHRVISDRESPQNWDSRSQLWTVQSPPYITPDSDRIPTVHIKYDALPRIQELITQINEKFQNPLKQSRQKQIHR